MSEWKELAHFLYGRGFWYADPLKEIDGLKEERLLWVPHPKALCILWHVGHIAHRERIHIGKYLQGLTGDLIPPQFEIFGTKWTSVEDLRKSIASVDSVLYWVKEIRKKSHEFIDSLAPEDFHKVPQTSHHDYPISRWLFITTCHTAVHIGIIQHLRASIEGTHERAC